jgi:hypothetical protein
MQKLNYASLLRRGSTTQTADFLPRKNTTAASTEIYDSSRHYKKIYITATLVYAGLPDGLFSNQKSQFGQILEDLDWQMFKYFMAIWNILWRFGI